MVAALYYRYRRSEDNWLSGFWARLVIALAIGVLLLTTLEIILVLYGPVDLRIFIAKYYFFVFTAVWAATVYYVHKITIPNNLLYQIELAPEDYQRGNILAFLLLLKAGLIFISVILYTKDM